MKEHTRREVLPPSIIFLCALILFYLAANQSQPTPNSDSVDRASASINWLSILHEAASQSIDFPNSAVSEAMGDIQTFTDGLSLSWPECQQTTIQVNLLPVIISGMNMMAITDKSHIETLGENGEIAIQAEWLVSTLLWKSWEAQRAESLWHELFHLRQICRLMSQVDVTQGLSVANESLIQVLRGNRAEMEAEVIGSQAYWYLGTGDTDVDLLLQSSVDSVHPTLLETWKYFFMTDNVRLWNSADIFQKDSSPESLAFLTVNSDGLPELQDHPNWSEWVRAVDELYVKSLAAP